MTPFDWRREPITAPPIAGFPLNLNLLETRPMESFVKVDVMDLHTGETLGQTEMSLHEWSLYEAGNHPRYDSNSGSAAASEVLEDDEIDAMGISPTTSIWLER